ncbi:Uncharacterised protein [[Clostridium] symbiosum]|jgi:hypothetical protein|uniref:hypothetical protein n=1 Tax=Clostridium symbiosum TaxID=1512 RepID=UPI0006C5161F|nr:hypothetical protein [[Clostridium] symbiosum]CUO67388.1 Uncharacterised protein [[Clostridium] symbiosum]
MNKDKLILKNGAEIELEAGASLGALQVLSADRAAMLATWELLTPDNLAAVQIKNGAGLTVGTYTDLVLVSETSVVASDGTVLTTYSLREKTTEERRLDALELGQQVQDGALEDLGAVTSTLAAQMEGGTL